MGLHRGLGMKWVGWDAKGYVRKGWGGGYGKEHEECWQGQEGLLEENDKGMCRAFPHPPMYPHPWPHSLPTQPHLVP